MKPTILLAFLLLLGSFAAISQITSPQIRAAFGVDADLRSHYFNSFVQLGNDDWFNQRTGVADTGRFVIDTTGAAAIVAGYNTNPSSRTLPFFRAMRYPKYTVVNNRLLMDAVMIRDYHGDDSTVFASGSNKNGDSPNDWSCPVSQGIPDKNDILDMFLHVRRAGPTDTDSLWMFGGLSLDNTTGNRYFDFEMYQTDVYYDRASRRFYNYGPDAGHTRWQLDAAGNVTVPGDCIFNAAYQSSSLTSIEARIWVHVSALSITPAQFNWTGQFDGAYNGAPYGYASIVPKTAGAYYTGLQCSNNTWGGPFSIVLQNNSLATNYAGGQLVEFSVNLTKLGLDPVTLMGGNVCGMPFRRMLVKTRASSSFTAELKDFVGPFDMFLTPRVQIQTFTPYICDTGSAAQIFINNPVPTSLYEWSTTNGRIVGPTTGNSIMVDTPGTYLVHQYLQLGCTTYATDTLAVQSFGGCSILATKRSNLSGNLRMDKTVILSWDPMEETTSGYIIERSEDGRNFIPIGNTSFDAEFIDNFPLNPQNYYRVKCLKAKGPPVTSEVIKVMNQLKNTFSIYPNPAQDELNLRIDNQANNKLSVHVLDANGQMRFLQHLQPGMARKEIKINTSTWPSQPYFITITDEKHQIIAKQSFIRQ